jgi:Zinc knuckle
MQNGTPPDYGDWDTFVIALNDRFMDPIARQEASRQLFTARQGQLPLDEFFNFFDLWVSLSSINNDWVLLDLMKDTVNPQIVQALGIRGWPATYVDFKLTACELDHIQQDLRQGSMFSGGNRQNMQPPPYAPRTSAYQGISQQACHSGRRQPNAFYFLVPVVDNIPSYIPVQTGTGTTFVGHGQPMEIGRRRQNRPGSCHQCGQIGHFARDCPHRQGSGGGQQGQRHFNAPRGRGNFQSHGGFRGHGRGRGNNSQSGRNFQFAPRPNPTQQVRHQKQRQNHPPPNQYNGQGTGQNGPTREQLRSMLQSFGLEDRLDLVTEMAKDLRLGN